ncbi:MAG: AEC family transporter [Planctomycetota bacterium]
MLVIDTIAPIALVILLGAVLRRSGFASAALFLQTNRLVFWVGIPCLLFEKTAGAAGQGAGGIRIFLVLLVGMVGCIVLGYLSSWALRLPGPAVGAFVQAAYRGNLAYLGLPVVFYALAGAGGETTPEYQNLAVMAIAPLIPLYNAAAVLVLLIGQKHDEPSFPGRVRHVSMQVATNPLLLACVAGIGWSLTGWPLPLAAARAFGAVGQMALPLALLGIGASLRLDALKGGWVPAAACSLIKVAAAPLIGYFAGRCMGLPGDHLLIAVIFLGCPTAVVSWVMAEQLDGDRHLAAGAVVISTLLSMATLAVILLAAR